jgi:hypothetical protein
MNEKQTHCPCCTVIEAQRRAAQGGCPPVGSTKETFRVGTAKVVIPHASRVAVLKERVQAAWDKWNKAACRTSALEAALGLSLSSGKSEARHVVVLAEIIGEAKSAASILYAVMDAVEKEYEQAKKEAESNG